MTQQLNTGKTVAPLRNVAALVELVQTQIDRHPDLPRMGCFYGPSGYGKTTACVYAMNHFDAYYIELMSSWTKKKICETLLLEMDIQPEKTITSMLDQIAQELVQSGRPLIIDEADQISNKKSMIELLRDMYKAAQTPIILVGEERLPQDLQQWERVHGRISKWTAAQPASLTDLEHLIKIWCPDVVLDDPFKSRLLEESLNSIRRCCFNLQTVRELAATFGVDHMNQEIWGDRKFFKTVAPRPRGIRA